MGLDKIVSTLALNSGAGGVAVVVLEISEIFLHEGGLRAIDGETVVYGNTSAVLAGHKGDEEGDECDASNHC